MNRKLRIFGPGPTIFLTFVIFVPVSLLAASGRTKPRYLRWLEKVNQYLCEEVISAGYATERDEPGMRDYAQSFPETWRHEIGEVWNTLVSLERDHQLPEIREGEEFRIINVGSRISDVNYVLASYFSSGRFLEPDGPVKIYVYSDDLSSIDIAEKLHQNFSARLPMRYRALFHVVEYDRGNPADPASMQKIVDPIDLVVMRTPRMGRDSKKWEAILRNVTQKMRAKARIIVSHYQESESKESIPLLEKCGFKVVRASPNQFYYPPRFLVLAEKN